MNLNKVFILGRLAADPETRNTPSGQTVSTVRLATNRVWNDQAGNKQEQTEFHTIVIWGKLAETVSKYLQKGQLAFFEGRLQNRSWQGQDGLKRYATEIIAEGMQMGPRSSGAGFSGGSNPAPAFANRPPAPTRPLSSAGKKPLKEDDIPVINEDFPIANPIASSNEVEEADIDLKDIPF